MYITQRPGSLWLSGSAYDDVEDHTVETRYPVMTRSHEYCLAKAPITDGLRRLDTIYCYGESMSKYTKSAKSEAHNFYQSASKPNSAVFHSRDASPVWRRFRM